MACKFDYAALLLASALALAPVHALATPKVLSVTETVRAEETDSAGLLLHDTGPQTADPSGTKARVTLGDGMDAFGQPAFAEAFAALPNGLPSFWVSLSSDSNLPPLLGGNGRASAEVTFTAIKKTKADTIIMHVDGGNLQLLDGDFGRIPLRALVALNFQVSTAAGAVDTFSLEDEIFGNSGVNGHSTFNFKLGGGLRAVTHYALQSDSDNNVVGETAEIDKFDLPVSLSNVPVNTQFTLDVTLDGEVFSPGGEVISRAFLRDPAHIDDADPLAGAVSIILGESPVVSVPEPSTASLLVVALPALLVLLRRRGWSVSRG